jgi:hypothetical protein
MNKSVSVVLPVVGIVLLVWGVRASESLSSDIAQFFTGSPTNKAIWPPLGGIFATVAGRFGV